MNKRLEPFLLYFFQVLSIISLYVFYLEDKYFPFWFFLGTFLLVNLFRKYTIELIILCNLLCFYFWDTIELASRFDLVSVGKVENSPVERTLAIVGLLSSFFLFKKLLKKIPIEHSTFFVLLFLPLASLFISKVIGLSLIASLVVRKVWYFLIYYKHGDSTEERTVGEQVKLLASAVSPFWSKGPESREFLNFNLYLIHNSSELRKCILSGSLMIIRGVAIIFLFRKIDAEFLGVLKQLAPFQTINISSVRQISVGLFKSSGQIPVFYLWITIIFNGIHFLFETFYGFGSVSIGIARMLGFNFNSFTNKPWMAKSFPDFCGRFMYYYSFILVNYFYLPIQKLAGKLKLPLWIRKRLSIFIAISIGGIYFHLMKLYADQLITESVNKSSAFYVVESLLYFSSFAFFCSIFTFEQSKTSSFVFRGVSCLFYLFLYSFLFSTQHWNGLGGLVEIQTFLLRLVSLN